MTDLTLYREYEPWECGVDGYPLVWHVCPRCEGSGSITGIDVAAGAQVEVECSMCEGTGKGVKHFIRIEAGHRCLRCGHPYRVGESAVVEEASRRESRALDPQTEFPAFAAPSGSLADPELGVEAIAVLTRKVLWSPCDDRCEHPGPYRARRDSEDWTGYTPETTGAAVSGFMVAQGFEVQAAWRILTVHHLNGRKHDLRWWNLASLCQRCHLHIQKKVVMERVFPFEHTDWFKPYAAGWYAYAYKGENLTREQAEERLDELLSLERMA